jgi:protein-S-isoprenylcysteine O-methyltransferase Ste14
MSEIVYKIAFCFLWVCYVSIRTPHAKKYEKIEKIKSVDKSRERIMMIFLMIGLTIIPMLWVVTTWLNAFEMNLPFIVRIFGIAMAVFSLWYFWIIHKTLGENWSPTLEISINQKIIKHGPYRKIRHPMYTQIWIWTIAQGLIISNWIAGLIGILLWAVLYFYRVYKEEKMMLDEFKEEYADYMEVTGRIFPRLSSLFK